MSDPVRLVSENQGETKHERFRRLAGKRMQKILRGLDPRSKRASTELANLSGPTYEYGEAEVDRIIAALRDRIDEVEHRLRRRKKEKVEFAFE